MRKLLLTFGGVFLFIGIYAQQDAQYTQFMFNKMYYNPAYASSTEYPCISCLHRSQWLGIEGAPTSQSINARIPMWKKRIGMGIGVNHDVIGPTNSWNFSLMYGYRIPMNKGNLNIGLQGSLRAYRVNWDQLEATLSGDASIPMGESLKTIPNFGAGVYYENPSFYVGASIPHFLHGDLSDSEFLFSNSDYGREELHAYLMSGAIFKLGKNVKLKPAFLIKYARNTPFDLDFNTSFIFFDQLTTGVTYRLGGLRNDFGESLDLILQYQFNPVRIGLAYDFTLSEVKDYTTGTFEIFLEYCINPSQDKLTNPRFF